LNKEFPPGFEKDEKNISIDFDGVIHNWDKGWHDGTCYGEPIEGALEAIKLLSKKYQNIIFTAKCKPDRPPVNGKTGKQLVLEWLKKHGVIDYVSEVTHEKPRAKIYIDDKGYRFKTWQETLKYLNE
jgi:hypothetical protein